MSKKNVLIISQKLNGGGAERVASNLSITLSESEKYNVFLALFDSNNQTYPYAGTLIDLDLKPCSSRIGKMLLLVKRILALKKVKSSYNIDVSISLLSSPNLINVLSRKNDRVIVSVRNLISRSAGKMEKVINRISCNRSDKVIALSRTVELDLIRNLGVKENKLTTIYNSCDGNKLLKLSEDDSVQIPDYPYIVTMGRLTKQKGHWHLIRAFSLVHQQIPDLKLIILGEGEYENLLHKQINVLGLQDHIIMSGYVKSPHRILQNSKAFVFSSLFEGLGNVILEALACGVPVISVDCIAGPKEILSGQLSDDDLFITTKGIDYAEYGILTEPFPADGTPNIEDTLCSNQEKYFSEAIIKLLSDNIMQEHYRKKSMERIADFSPSIIDEQWQNVIDKI